jgi:hypothetical protein
MRPCGVRRKAGLSTGIRPETAMINPAIARRVVVMPAKVPGL